MMLCRFVLSLRYFITDFCVGKDLFSYILFVCLIFWMHQLNQPYLVNIDSSRFLQNSQVFNIAPLFWSEREFQQCWPHHTIYDIKYRIKGTAHVMSVVWDSQHHTYVIFLRLPSINILNQSGDTVDRTIISEWLRLHHRLKFWNSMRASIFLRDKRAIKETETIIFIVSTLTESIKESRLTESCVDRLRLTTEVWFGSGNNNFFLEVHSCSDASNKVDDFCFQYWLFVVSVSYLLWVNTFLNRLLFSFHHLHHILRYHISIMGLLSNFVLKKFL